MSDTKKMIEIINQNRNKQYKIKKQIYAKEKARKDKISDTLAFFEYLIIFIAFVEVISKLITK